MSSEIAVIEPTADTSLEREVINTNTIFPCDIDRIFLTKDSVPVRFIRYEGENILVKRDFPNTELPFFIKNSDVACPLRSLYDTEATYEIGDHVYVIGVSDVAVVVETGDEECFLVAETPFTRYLVNSPMHVVKLPKAQDEATEAVQEEAVQEEVNTQQVKKVFNVYLVHADEQSSIDELIVNEQHNVCIADNFEDAIYSFTQLNMIQTSMRDGAVKDEHWLFVSGAERRFVKTRKTATIDVEIIMTTPEELS